MSLDSFENNEQLVKPDFSYDPITAEASIAVPSQPRVWLTDVSIDDGEILSVVTGTNSDGETVVIELIDSGPEQEVTKVMVDDTEVFAVTKH
jgi:hypothetical protein